MKVELRTYVSGDIALEIITETPAELALIKGCWLRNGYKQGYGQSGGDEGAIGFYIPLVEAKEPDDG